MYRKSHIFAIAESPIATRKFLPDMITSPTHRMRQIGFSCISLFFSGICISQVPLPIGPATAETYGNVRQNTDTLPIQDTAFHYAEEVIADRLAQLQSSVPLHYNKDVQAFIEFFTARKRDFTQRVLNHQSFYFPIFEAEFKAQEMPVELKYLSVVESGLNPKAVSRAGAVGLWQFMPYTGKEQGLYQDGYLDERMDIYKSTQAACAYLKKLYGMFSDWELALAAYNCGPGAVRRAIRRSGNRTSFWEIYPHLPRETRSYVPIYVAVTYVMNFHQDYHFTIDSPVPYVVSDTVHITQHIDLKLLATELDVPFEDIQTLNPHLKRNLIPAYPKNYPLRLPSEKAVVLREYKPDMLLAASSKKAAPSTTGFDLSTLAASIAPQPKDTKEEARKKAAASVAGRQKLMHTVATGDVLGSIAEVYDVGVSELRRWNNLRGNSIRAGQRIAVWVQQHTASRLKSEKASVKTGIPQSMVAAQAVKALPVANGKSAVKNSIAKNAKTPLPAKPRGGVYEVQPGDTLWSISKNQGVPVETIKKLNKLKSNDLQAGQKLIVG